MTILSTIYERKINVSPIFIPMAEGLKEEMEDGENKYGGKIKILSLVIMSI